MYNGVELRSWSVERPGFWSSFPYGKVNEMIYESGHIYVNIRKFNRV